MFTCESVARDSSSTEPRKHIICLWYRNPLNTRALSSIRVFNRRHTEFVNNLGRSTSNQDLHNTVAPFDGV